MKLRVYWKGPEGTTGVADYESPSLYSKVDAMGNLCIGDVPFPNDRDVPALGHYSAGAWLACIPENTKPLEENP